MFWNLMETSQHPSPERLNVWLTQRLAETRVSQNALARNIGRSRAEVTRWASGREQIPRDHLRQIALEIGQPGDFSRVLSLKDVEDAEDALTRACARLGRRLKTEPSPLFDAFLATVTALGPKEYTESSALTARVELLASAGFAAQQWLSYAEDPDAGLFQPILIGRHLRYPVNHFMGSLMQSASPSSVQPVTEMALQELRARVANTTAPDEFRLTRFHSLHMLARYGTATDRAFVQELVIGGVNSPDPLSRKLGLSGLVMANDGPSDAPQRFLDALTHDQELAHVDVSFDATHYGDLRVSTPLDLNRLDGPAPNLLRSIAKHYGRPTEYAKLAEIDAFRAASALYLTAPSKLPADILPRFNSLIELNLIDVERPHQRRLATLVKAAGAEHQAFTEALMPQAASSQPSESAAEYDFDVFISYSTEDLAAARRIRSELANNGLTSFLDEDDLPLGESHQNAMQHAIRSSTIALILVGSRPGRWQRHEIDFAISDSVETGRRVIPFVLRGDVDGIENKYLAQFAGIVVDRYGSMPAAMDALCRRLLLLLR